MKFSTVVIAVALLATFSLRSDACMSEGIREQKMATYESRCRELGLKDSEIECLLKEGDAFDATQYHVHGRLIICYPENAYQNHMVDAMRKCLPYLESVSVRKVANGVRDVIEPKMPPRVYRRSIEPTTPMTKVAHWLGLKETVRGGCGCMSGCHYCCINTSLSAEDKCFNYFCNNRGYCR